MNAFDPYQFAEQLRELLELLPPEVDRPSQDTSRLRALRKDIQTAILKLDGFRKQLDPIEQPSHVFDPSNPHTMGELIARTLLDQERHALGAVDRFYGSGVYAIYYKGDFEAYRPIAGRDHPIYVGVADPQSPQAATVEEQGCRLARRLTDHRRSIEGAENLDLDEFDCRYLVVRSAWQRTAETYLINTFHPVWNNESGVCYGFGKHGDAAKTRTNTRSPWDTLHPGRPWAASDDNLPNPKSAREITAEIAEHFETFPPMDSAT